MTPTIQEIYAQIVTEKESKPELNGLDSDSATAIWRLWAYVTAAILWAHYKYYAAYQALLQKLVDESITGTGSWYARELRKFQLGDDLVVLPSGKLGYLVIDTAKQIIAHSSYLEQPGGLLTLKAAKEVAGNLVPLTASEVIQVKGYLARKKFAGVDVSLISEVADKLRANIDIYYNSLFDLPALRISVEAAIDQYLSTLDFDGFVYASKLQDAIQAVEGVADVQIQELSGVSTQGISVFDRIYRARAGYIEPSTEPGFSLADTLNFEAQ